MIYRFIILSGPLNGQRITVDTKPMTVGRDPGCTICLPDEEVASQHAVVEHTRDGLVIRDLGTMNRILVNKREVRAASLKHGDVIELGHTRFLVQALVQSEVHADRLERARRRVRNFMLATVLGLVIAGLLAGWFWKHRTRSPATGETPAPSESPQASGQESPAVTDQVDVQEVSDEIRNLRAALADIRSTVQQLSIPPKPQPAPPVAVPTNIPPVVTAIASVPTPPPQPDPVQERTQALLNEALQELTNNNLIRADELAVQLQQTAPDFLPAYELRAQLYEKQGQLEKAMGQWLEIIQRSAVTSLYERAISERTRLRQEETAPVLSPVPRIKIASVEQYKFRESEDYEEMRILNIALRPEGGESKPDPRAVRVEVSFFDEDTQTQSVTLTRAVTPKAPIVPAGEWDETGTLNVSATYVIPRTHPGAAQAASRSGNYYGYVVHVYYGEELQDEQARPRNLLEKLRRPPESGGTSAQITYPGHRA